MGEIFGFVYALIKAIPIVKSWVDQFSAWYVERAIREMKDADKKALRKAVYDQDQRDLERQLGNSHPGEVSGIGGTDIVSTLPNVVPNTNKGGN